MDGSQRTAEAGPPALLPSPLWRAREQAHQRRADELTAGWRRRRATGETHAIEDFLFTYYPYRPARLRRWHPGAGAELADAGADRATWTWYRAGSEPGSARVDAAAFMASHGPAVAAIRAILGRTAARAGQFGCFGLHEWAMVYRQPQRRHDALPLRLSAERTDEVVRSHRIRCSHFDAYRFFTPDAAPLNQLRPTREAQAEFEQPGCLHAGMDVYKWAVKLGPLVPGEVLLDAFELAKEIRVLDMAASPYDVSRYGVAPVAIETPQGKAQYVAAQRAFAQRSNALRARVLEALDRAEATGG